MARLEINVKGTGTAIRHTERGLLVVQAQARSFPTTAEASTAVTATVNKVRELLTPYCASEKDATRNSAISHYFMGTLETSNQRDSHAGGMLSSKSSFQITHSAHIDISIEFRDFDALHTLARRFPTMENLRVQRISWHLTEETLALVEGSARKRAAQDALQHARDYAEVFGGLSMEEAVQKVKAVDVRENAQCKRSWKPRLHHVHEQEDRVRNEKGKPEVRVEPVDVVVEVSVNAKFVVES